MCPLAVLGSQGIVVKCTAAIFFRTEDSPTTMGVPDECQSIRPHRESPTLEMSSNEVLVE